MRETLNDWVLRPISKSLQIFIIIIDPEKSIHNYVLSWNKNFYWTFISKINYIHLNFNYNLREVLMRPCKILDLFQNWVAVYELNVNYDLHVRGFLWGGFDKRINFAESQNIRNILRCTRTTDDFGVVIVTLQ